MALNRVLPGLAPGALAVGSRQTGSFGEGLPPARPRGEMGREMGLSRSLEAGLEMGAPANAMQAGQRARWTLGAMVGRSSEMERLFLQMRYVANHLKVALMEGERGTGKQLAARTLHDLSNARGRGFLACRAADFLLAPDLHERLARVRGGTLYLSDVDGLNAEGQGRLLHLLNWLAGAQGKPGARSPSGSQSGWRNVPHLAGVANGNSDGKEDRNEEGPGVPRALIAGSTRSLRSLVLHGSFRGELHAQLSVVQMAMPALRDRRADIPMLVEALLAHAPNAHGRPMRGILQEALPALLAQPWAGNVAELRDLVRQAAERSEGEWLRRADLRLPGESTGYGRAPGVAAMDREPAVPGAARSAGGATWIAPRGAGPRLAAMHPSPETRPETHLGPEAFRGSRVMEGNGNNFAYRAARGNPPASPEDEGELDPNLDRAILRHIRRVLESVGGNKLRAARLLGISRSTLYRLLETEPAGGGSSTEGRMAAGLREPAAISAMRR